MMPTREALRPYRKKRLAFEGVLISIIEPNRRNGYTYGLVFGSVYAPNEQIELDHAVIRIQKRTFRATLVTLFKRYRFTAQVDRYHKVVNVLGADVLQENFMLQNLNTRTLKKINTTQLTQPTQYVLNRIQNVMMCKTQEIRHTEEELLAIIFQTPNDGSVEKFIEQYAKTYQHRKIDEFEMIEVLYPNPVPEPHQNF